MRSFPVSTNSFNARERMPSRSSPSQLIVEVALLGRKNNVRRRDRTVLEMRYHTAVSYGIETQPLGSVQMKVGRSGVFPNNAASARLVPN